MRIGLTVVLFAALVTVSHAQSKKIQLGFAAAININPYLDKSNELMSPTAAPGYSVGLVARKYFSDNLSFDVEAHFTKIVYRGVVTFDELNGYYNRIHPDDPLLEPVDFDGSYAYSNSYIEVPLEINFRVDDRAEVDWIASAGIVNSFGVSAKSQWPGNESKVTEDYNAYLTNIKVGFGVLVDKPKVSIGVEPQLRYALLQDFEFAESKALYIGLETFILLHGGSN